MAVVGRVGGDQADAGNQAFSGGFGWCNYDLGLSGGSEADVGSASRRAMNGGGKCDLSVGIKLVEKVSVCSLILICVAAVRVLVKTIYVRKYPEDPNPPDLAFPNWEGVWSICKR